VDQGDDDLRDKVFLRVNVADDVVDGRGRRLASLPNLIAYLRDLEVYIAGRPERCFFNAGEP
jgi:hypothetical protein